MIFANGCILALILTSLFIRILNIFQFCVDFRSVIFIQETIIFCGVIFFLYWYTLFDLHE